MTTAFKETFVNRFTNAAAIAASAVGMVEEDQVNAEKNDNLPHNVMVLTNQSSACTIFVFLDHWSDLTTPDYVLFPSQTMAIAPEEGVSFTTVYFYNTHASTDVAIGELKGKIATAKRID